MILGGRGFRTISEVCFQFVFDLRRIANVEPATPAGQVKLRTDRIPPKRCGILDGIASLATWIVSPEASFNTGFTFDLAGGRAVY